MRQLRVLLLAFATLALLVVAYASAGRQSQEIPSAQAAMEVVTVPTTVATTTAEAPTTTTSTTEAPVESTSTTIYVQPTTTTSVVTYEAPQEPVEAFVEPEPVYEAPVVQDGSGGNASDDAFVQCIIARESGGDPTVVNSSSGAAGLAQYLPSTWAALGYADRYGVWSAHLATYGQQMEAIYDTLARAGRSPWYGPGCS